MSQYSELFDDLPDVIEHNGKQYSIDKHRLHIKQIGSHLSVFLKNGNGDYGVHMHTYNTSGYPFNRYKYEYRVWSFSDYSSRSPDEIDIIDLGFKIAEIIKFKKE